MAAVDMAAREQGILAARADKKGRFHAASKLAHRCEFSAIRDGSIARFCVPSAPSNRFRNRCSILGDVLSNRREKLLLFSGPLARTESLLCDSLFSAELTALINIFGTFLDCFPVKALVTLWLPVSSRSGESTG
jgi:hypothetical protein